MKYLIYLYLLWTPLFYWIGIEMRYAQELIYQMMAMTIFFTSFFSIKKPVKLTWVSLFIGLFGIWSVYLFAISRCQVGFNYVFNYLCGCLVYFTVISCMSKKDTKFLFNAVLIAFSLNTIYAACQMVGWDVVGFVCVNQTNRLPDPCGLLALPAHYGIYSAVAMMISFLINPFLPLAFGLSLFISKSSGAILGAVLGYLFILWCMRYSVRMKVSKKHYIPLYMIMSILLTVGSVLYVFKIDLPMKMFEC